MEALREYDQECPEVFLILYWGYRSPWWLLHGDVLFEPGLNIEAASPSASPTLYVRDGVTVGLDQAQWWCEDLPPLGKDSLGVWLSNWPWNSSIGAERWQEAFIMDICRGSLLAQPWSDWNFLTPPERRQMADFIALLRAHPACFAHPRFVLGNPWKAEPYGYCCTDGKRAFIALNNCTWKDVELPLHLSEEWGLPSGAAWDLYRWYPAPARLAADVRCVAMRPFEVVLLEAVPRGTAPSLERVFVADDARASREAPSHAVLLEVRETAGLSPLALPCDVDRKDGTTPQRTFSVAGRLPASQAEGLLVVTLELLKHDRLLVRADPGRYFAASARLEGQPAPADAVVRERSYPSGWQAWRVPVTAAARERTFDITVTAAADAETTLRWSGHFIPNRI
jgi:hypothetical protein